MATPEPVPVASQYENLRKAALGEPAPPEFRSGLVLFLRCGMWGWARALATAVAPQQSTRSYSTSSTAPSYQQRAVVHVFAAMALDSSNGRAR